MSNTRFPAGPRVSQRPRPGEAGTSISEVVVVAATIAVVAAIALPVAGSSRDLVLAAGGARHLASRVHQVRSASVARGVHVAMVFQIEGQDYRFALFADGNYNGVRSAEIARGIDQQVSPWERLADNFAGVTFGVMPGVTEPDSTAILSGTPLKLGGSDMLSFGPTGGSTSGTLYIRGRAGQQFAVRVLGTTGRARLLRFDSASHRWVAP